MATVSETPAGQRQSLSVAIAAELQRQGITGVDVEALAAAIQTAIAAQAPITEGRHPDQLNATNDD